MKKNGLRFLINDEKLIFDIIKAHNDHLGLLCLNNIKTELNQFTLIFKLVDNKLIQIITNIGDVFAAIIFLINKVCMLNQDHHRR